MISKDPPVVIERHDEVNVVVLLQVLWRHRYFVAAIGIVSGLIAVYLAMTATHVYRAEVVLTEVSTGGMDGGSSLTSRLGGLASLAGLNIAGGEGAREAHAVLRSRHLAEEFIKRYDLIEDLAGNSARQTLWFAVDRFRQNVLQIRDEKNKGTTVVEIKWSNPQQAAQWANDYVALVNETLRTRALNESSRNIKYLNEQIAKTNVVELQRVLYSLVESETKTHMLANARAEYAFTVVDPAVTPESRIWPRRTLMVLTGSFLGLFFGAFLALAYDFWRRNRNAWIDAAH